MNTSKIIKGVVGNGRYTTTAPIIKEDYGLYLKIEGVELPSTYEVDFSNSENSGTSVTMIGNSDGVLIPRQFIDSGKDVFAFLYHVGADYGRTVYKFRIPNKVRPDRTDETPTPEEQGVIDQAINALNEAVAQTAQDVESADQSAQSAQGYAEQAETARDTAQTYANNAQTSATQASTSASQASTSASASAQSAQSAEQTKTEVEGMVDDAQGYAQASAQSASTSANSASQAQGYAQSASSSAQSASGYASSAQTSADTASAKAQDASQSATTASQKATESAQSASQALTYKTDAESAKTASQTAQGLAESARDTAVQAKTDAESARDDAESARDEAQTIVDGISGALDDKAPVITDTASGSIASFSDGADNLPLKSLVVDINPIQDLHGQESPYLAGGGKNKITTTEYNGGLYNKQVGTSLKTTDESRVRYVQTNNVITISNDTTYFLNCLFATPLLPVGTYTVHFETSASNNRSSIYTTTDDLTVLSIAENELGAKTVSKTITLEESARIAVALGTNGGEATITNLQVESGSAYTSWSPYENICPISGWTQVGVEQSGKNLLDLSILRQGEWDNTTRTYNVAFDEYLPIQGNVTYAWSSAVPSIAGRYLRFYDSNKQYISSVSLYDTGTKTFTAPSNAAFYRAMWYRSNGITPSDITEDQIQVGTTDTPYSPYTGRSITIDLGQTVYGGKLDVLSGQLTIDMAMVDLGTLNYGYNATGRFYNTLLVPNFKRAFKTAERATGIVCGIYKASSSLQYNDNQDDYSWLRGMNTNTYDFVIKDTRYTDATAFKTAMSGVMLCYELATPITIQLTPNQVNSLLGVNNIWSDSGDTEVVYRADTKLYIERLTAPDSADMIADANITSGKYFMVGNSLYKATANIANGASIIVGTNCIRKSLSEALNEINA